MRGRSVLRWAGALALLVSAREVVDEPPYADAQSLSAADAAALASALLDDGFALVPGALGASFVAAMRCRTEHFLELGSAATGAHLSLQDALHFREFRPFLRPLLSNAAVNSVLDGAERLARRRDAANASAACVPDDDGGRLTTFLGHNNIAVGTAGEFWRRGVHSQYFTRDRPECRSANTSVGGRIYTIATYLEDHSRDDEGLRVWPRSHRDAELCYDCWSAPPAGEARVLRPALGDVVLFDQRLLRSGSPARAPGATARALTLVSLSVGSVGGACVRDFERRAAARQTRALLDGERRDGGVPLWSQRLSGHWLLHTQNVHHAGDVHVGDRVLFRALPADPDAPDRWADETPWAEARVRRTALGAVCHGGGASLTREPDAPACGAARAFGLRFVLEVAPVWAAAADELEVDVRTHELALLERAKGPAACAARGDGGDGAFMAGRTARGDESLCALAETCERHVRVRWADGAGEWLDARQLDARGLPLELLPPAALPDDARVALSVSPRLPQGVATLRFHADDDLDALAYTFAQRHNLTRGAGCADSACVARRITVSMRAERDRARRAARLKFIHISKTAGSYIENIGHNVNLQWGSYDKEYGYFHRTLSRMPERVRAKYDWFMVVRNPYERVVSEFNWFHRESVEKNRRPGPRYFVHEFVNSRNRAAFKTMYHPLHANDTTLFNRAIRHLIAQRSGDGDHFTEQFLYLSPCLSGVCKIHVLRYENIGREFEALMEQYGINLGFNESDKYNTAHASSFTTRDLDSSSIDLIREAYRRDFAHFGYSTELP